MAKKAKKRAPRKLTRRQRSRLEREKRWEKILIWSVAALGVIILGLLGYGLVLEKVIKAREPVAIVGDSSVTTSEFQDRVRFQRHQLNEQLRYWYQVQQSIDPEDSQSEFYLEYVQGQIRELQSQLAPMNFFTLGDQVLEQLIQDELIRQEAARRDITVTPEEVQQEIEQQFGYERNPGTDDPEPTAASPLTPTNLLTPTATPLPTSTPVSEEVFRQRYSDFLNQTLKPLDISEREYRSWVEAALLMEKVKEEMAPASAEQVKLRYLIVESEERADELAARWDAGEEFDSLVEELRSDEESPGYGTELDWYPKSIVEMSLGADLADLAFSLDVGERSEPVPGEDGERFTIIQVLGRETRELDELTAQQLAEQAFQEWLEAQEDQVERLEYDPEILPMEL